jgi:hypothetical protein
MIDLYVIELDFGLRLEDWKRMGIAMPGGRIEKRPKGPGWMARQTVDLYPDKVWLRVCPPKVLGQWNVYGSNDLRELVMKTAPLVLEELGIEVTRSRLKQLKEGAYTVKAVDITEQFKLPEMSAAYFIRKFNHQMMPLYVMAKHEKGEGLLIHPGSRTLEVYFYDKKKEFEDRGMNAYAAALAALPPHARNGFEAQVMLVDRERQRHLAALGPRLEMKFGDGFFTPDNKLSRGEKWKTNTAEKLYQKKLAELEFPRRIEFSELIEDGYISLQQPYLGTFLLWLYGEDRAIAQYSQSKQQGHAKHIESKLGVNVRKPASVVIKTKDAIRPRKVFKWGNRVRADVEFATLIEGGLGCQDEP